MHPSADFSTEFSKWAVSEFHNIQKEIFEYAYSEYLPIGNYFRDILFKIYESDDV